LSACALQPLLQDLGGTSEVEYLTRALKASPTARRTLWNAARDHDGTPEAQLRLAVMQSLPGHDGYDPGAAKRRLQSLSGPGRPPDVSMVARLRLAELRDDAICQGEIGKLQERLSQIVDIERSLYGNGGGGTSGSPGR
jgi:hypothetical protein